MMGASVVVLPPDSILDVEYVLKVIDKKQVSYMQTVPAYLDNMLNVLQKCDRSKFETMRTIDIGGE